MIPPLKIKPSKHPITPPSIQYPNTPSPPLPYNPNGFTKPIPHHNPPRFHPIYSYPTTLNPYSTISTSRTPLFNLNHTILKIHHLNHPHSSPKSWIWKSKITNKLQISPFFKNPKLKDLFAAVNPHYLNYLFQPSTINLQYPKLPILLSNPTPKINLNL